MHVILLGIGTFMAIVGVVLIRYGVPLDEYGNSPLLMSGMVALVGGFLLIALFMVARNLNRIAERLEIQPMPLPPIADISRSDPPPRPTVAPSAIRPEPPPIPIPAPDAAAPEPRVEPKIEPRMEPAPAADAAPAKPALPPPKPLFGLFGAKRKTAEVNQKVAPSVAPPEDAGVDLGPLAAVPEREPRPAPPPPANDAAPKPAAPAPSGEVYKSGVIDGMAYTLYTDGSIEAQLPQGTIRFASVEELQKYLVGRA